MSDLQRSWETFIARIKHCGAGEYGSAHFICSKHEHWKFLWAADRIEKLEQQLAELESEKARLEARIMTQMLEGENEATR